MNAAAHAWAGHSRVPGFDRIFQRTCSVIGSENNAIASIASARNVDFTTAREIYEAERNQEPK